LKIIQLDLKKQKISLSKKAIEDNPWKNVTVRRGDITKATVKEVTKDGLTVEVQGVEGLIPNSELSMEKIGRPEDYFAVGDEVEALVIEANRDRWTMKLSIRRVQEKQERSSFEKYLEDEEAEDKLTIGDLFKDDLKK
ncbi:MAG: S1 RNA-binding domain-containing protein, partial [Acholeplasmataceae bacterium]